MTKKNLMPAVVLTSICIIVAVLLGVVNMFTGPVIDAAEAAKVTESLTKVMEGGEFNPTPDEHPADAPDTVKQIYTEKNGKGKVVVLITTKGFEGKEIGITVGIDNDGKITGMQVTKNEDSIVPPILKPGGGYGDLYKGEDATTVPELVTGVTVKYTESAIKNAVMDALNYLGHDSGGGDAAEQLPKTDEEILALADELSPDFGELEAVKLDGTSEFVKRLYRDKDGKGYFAYIVTSTEWNSHEAELAVCFDNNGKLTATRLLAWNLSPTYEHNNIPGDDFVAGLVGKDGQTLPSVELITNVTQTSGRVRDAVLSVSAALSLPTSEAEIADIAATLLGRRPTLEAVTLNGASEFVKRAYRLSDGSGYVAYIITNTEWNKHEAELVVTFDNGGEVTGAKLLAWNLSPTYEHKDIPGDGFVAGLVGKDGQTRPSVELVTNVTQTSGRVRDAVASVSASLALPTSKSDISAAAAELTGKQAVLESIWVDGLSSFVKTVYKLGDGSGYVAYIITNTEWNNHEAELIVTLDTEGKITGTKLLAWNLSPTYEHKDISGDDFVAGLVGKNEATLPSVELITNVTQTSGRVRDAVLSVSKAFSLPISLDEIKSNVTELLRKETSLEPYSAANLSEFVKRVYKLGDGSGYAAYILTNTEWNKHEAELVVTFDKSGTVTGVKLLAWNLSPTYEHKDIPGDDFAASLVGKGDATLPTVELVTNVTQTSGRVRDAVASVSAALSLPRPESEILGYIDELYVSDGANSSFTSVTFENMPAGVKRIYKNVDGTYAVYIVTFTEWNPCETELVVIISPDGKVTASKLLTWQLSPTYEHNDIPGDGFAAGLVGKDTAGVEGVELITDVTQTSGRVRDALAGAMRLMTFTGDGAPEYLARTVGIVILVLAVLVPVAVYIIKRRMRG